MSLMVKTVARTKHFNQLNCFGTHSCRSDVCFFLFIVDVFSVAFGIPIAVNDAMSLLSPSMSSQTYHAIKQLSVSRSRFRALPGPLARANGHSPWVAPMSEDANPPACRDRNLSAKSRS